MILKGQELLDFLDNFNFITEEDNVYKIKYSQKDIKAQKTINIQTSDNEFTNLTTASNVSDGTLIFLFQTIKDCLNNVLNDYINLNKEEIIMTELEYKAEKLTESPDKNKPWLLSKFICTIKYIL